MKKEKLIKFKKIDQLIKINHKTKEFKEVYNEEIMRLQMASEIRRLRTEKGFTQGVVAKKARMPQSVIARIESGNRSISLDTLGKVAHVFGKEVRLV